MSKFRVLLPLLAMAAAAIVPTVADAQVEPVIGDAEVTVTPDSDLVDFQTVAVSGSNFDPADGVLFAAQCARSATGTVALDQCDTSNFASGPLDGNGAAELELTVRRELVTNTGEVVDCADPDACAVGAATLESDLVTVIEGAIAPIAFDPDVPAVPRLDVDVAVADVDSNAITVAVTCNRDAEAFVDGFLTQTRGANTATASAFTPDPIVCSTSPTEVELTVYASTGKLRPGDASLELFAFAFDGFESAEESLETTVRLNGNPRKVEPVSQPGEFTSIEIVGVSGSGTDQTIDVDVTCSIDVDVTFVDVSVEQYVGNDIVAAFGSTAIEGCDGTQMVSVPIEAGFGGDLAGGPVRVVANTFSFAEIDGQFVSDSARAVDQVRLKGQIPIDIGGIVPVDGTYVTIQARTTDTISGIVSCDEAVTVSLDAFVAQQRGRVVDTAGGFTEIECDGDTPFDIALSGDLAPVESLIQVSAFAYRLVDVPGTSFPVFEDVWQDFVIEFARLRP